MFSAAGRTGEEKEADMPGFIEQEKWKSFLDEFTKRNQLRTTRLEVVGEIGAQQEEEYLPLVGVSFEPKGTAAGSVEVALGGETARDKRRVEHLIEKVQRIAPLIGPTGLEEGLALEDQDGTKTLLVFEELPEIPEKTSEARTEASSRA
jgi:Family of unknown function (DUF5335)